MSNNYKVSGKKMTSRFGCSHKTAREMRKAGHIPGETAAKEEICASYGRNAWNQLYREPARAAKKRLTARFYAGY